MIILGVKFRTTLGDTLNKLLKTRQKIRAPLKLIFHELIHFWKNNL
jgi:hypothetical protein